MIERYVNNLQQCFCKTKELNICWLQSGVPCIGYMLLKSVSRNHSIHSNNAYILLPNWFLLMSLTTCMVSTCLLVSFVFFEYFVHFLFKLLCWQDKSGRKSTRCQCRLKYNYHQVNNIVFDFHHDFNAV